MKKKRGLIRITEQLYNENWSEVSIIFKDFRPAHIEYRFYENGMWYFYGDSELFDEVEEGQVITEYIVIFTRQDDGSYKYKFQRS